MRHALFAVALATGLLASAGGCRSDDDEPTDPVVATVDGLALTEDDVLRSYVNYLITTGQNDTQALRERHVEALVDAYLLGAEAERRGLAADSALQVADARARRRLIGAYFFESSVFDTMATPTEAEVRKAYQQSREQRVVRQLYYTDPREAAAAYARLESGRPFLEEAWDLYDTTDSLAGSLGAVTYWQLDDAFAEAAFGTPVGAYTPPIRSRLGYHIILVEDRIRNPILAEDEFQRRRKGVESQLRLRRRRLEGDTAVRAFMEARDVQVNRAVLVSLQDAVRQLGELEPDAQQGSGALTPVQTRALTEALTPSTVLATYAWDGERVAFTLTDYVFWLSTLPPQEVRNRTGASLGRALRNDAFARAGESAGLGDEDDVAHELAKQRRLRLADALRAELRDQEVSSMDRARLGQVAGDLGIAPQQTLVDFWAVPFATRGAAEAALPALRDAPESASQRAGFESFRDTPLATVRPYAAALQGAPLGEPVLASVDDAWAVVRVASRRQEAAGTGADVLAPFAAEAELLERLRRERSVQINQERVRSLTRPPPTVSRGR